MTPPPDNPRSTGGASSVRLNKWLADRGVCSRREADVWIAAGRVQVNGSPIVTLGLKIDPERDVVQLDGATLIRPPEDAKKTYWAFHKPCGAITTRRDERDRATIYDCLPDACQACDPAGRLDRDSSGLLILSDDGDFIHRLTHPSFHVEKIYRVTVDRPLSPAAADALRKGVTLMPEAKLAQAQDVTILDASMAQLTLITGYNRQIRRMLQALGYRVRALKRIAVGPVRLGALKPGEVRALTPQELKALRDAFLAPRPRGQDQG